MVIAFKVTLTLPEGATPLEAEDYVRAAVQSYCGMLQPPGVDGGGSNPDAPGDPMFSLNAKSVRVRLLDLSS